MCPSAAAGAQPARGILGVRGARRKGQLAFGFSRSPSAVGKCAKSVFYVCLIQVLMLLEVTTVHPVLHSVSGQVFAYPSLGQPVESPYTSSVI